MLELKGAMFMVQLLSRVIRYGRVILACIL
jgi:hypothetical protein